VPCQTPDLETRTLPTDKRGRKALRGEKKKKTLSDTHAACFLQGHFGERDLDKAQRRRVAPKKTRLLGKEA